MRSPAFAVIVLLCALAACLSASQPPERPRQPDTDDKHERHDNEGVANAQDKRGSDGSPVVVRVLPTPPDPLKAKQEQDDRDSETADRRWTWALGALTILVAILQWKVMQRQADIADEQARIAKEQSELIKGQGEDTKASIAQATRAATASEALAIAMTGTLQETKRSADAAERSAGFARDALYLLEGASIQLQESVLEISEDEQMTFTSKMWNAALTLKWRNYGRSVAKDFVPDIVIGLEGAPVLGDPKHTPVVVAPGQTVSYGFRRLGDYFTPDEMRLVIEARAKLMFWGSVQYTDVFGQRTTLEVAAEWVHGTNSFGWIKHVETRVAPELS
jgi:hypothetical protein